MNMLHKAVTAMVGILHDELFISDSVDMLTLLYEHGVPDSVWIASFLRFVEYPNGTDFYPEGHDSYWAEDWEPHVEIDAADYLPGIPHGKYLHYWPLEAEVST